MNLHHELQKITNKAHALRVTKYIGNDTRKFDDLVKLFLNGPYRLAQRASWPLTVCVEKNPELAKPYLKLLLQNLKKEPLHDAVKRNTVRLFQYVDIPIKLQGLVVDQCFQYLLDPKEPIAVRVFSITVLVNIAQDKPELKRELILVLEDQLPYGSAGFISRAKKTLKQLRN
ncbi:MAG TPA: hypothetical protein PLV21_07855 [Cyclobacteriaceae bacterium]|nr:hypothetical protein [Cyclobacteriaceae bacterium]HRJ81780.1 hypothetical protein [Cyclobacteriaceae bacterium]